jgi:hypothetical protein
MVHSAQIKRLLAAAMALVIIACSLHGIETAARAQSRDGGGPSYGGQRGTRQANQATEGSEAKKKLEPPAPPAKSTGVAAQAEHKKPTYEHNRFVVSPDGKRIALVGAHVAKDAAGKADRSAKAKPPEPFLEVIDVATGRSLAVFKDGATYDNLAISPNGDFVAAEDVARRGTFKVWHIPTKKSKELQLATRVLAAGVAFSPDNRSLYLLTPAGMKMAPLAGGAPKEMKFDSPVVSANYCPANNLVAVGVSRSRYGKIELQVYDVATQKQVKNFTMPRLTAVVQFTSDGKYLGAALAGGAIGVWETGEWTEVGSAFNTFTFEPAQIAVAPDGATMAVRPKTLRGATTELIDSKSGEKKTPLIARDVYYLPTGIIALSNDEGPHYFDPAGAVALALPPAPVADPSQVADAPAASTQPYNLATGQLPNAAAADAARSAADAAVSAAQEAAARAAAEAAAKAYANGPMYGDQKRASNSAAKQPAKEERR